jgi:hypothetical protein
MTATSYGFPAFEVCCAAGGGNSVQNSTFNDLDVENNREIGLYLENANSCVATLKQLPTPADSTGVVFRSCSSYVTSLNKCTYDADGNAPQCRLDGIRGLTHQRYVPGNGIDASSGSNLSFSQIRGIGFLTPDVTSTKPDLYINTQTALAFGIGRADLVQARDTTISPPLPGITVFNGAASQTFTLPTIVTDTTPGATNLGTVYEIHNISPTNTLALATNGSQTFNNIASYFSHTCAIQSAVIAVACKNASGTLFWSLRSQALLPSG